MNKNHVFGGIAVLALIAVYFIFFSSTVYSFNSGLTQINSLWEKQELKPVDLTSPVKVYSLNEAKLINLKPGLTEFHSAVEKQEASEDKEKLLLLTEIELDLVGNALIQKKNFDLIDFFDSTEYDFDVLCSSMNKIDEFEANLLLQKDSAEAFNLKSAEFSSSFPVEAEKAEVSFLSLQFSSDNKLSQLTSIISTIKGVC